MANTVNFPNKNYNNSVELVAGDGTDKKPLNVVFTEVGGFSGGALTALYITNSSSSNEYWVKLYRSIGGTDYVFATVYVPVNSGMKTTGTQVEPVDVLGLGLFGSSIDRDNLFMLPIDATTVYKVGMDTAVSGSDVVTVNADFIKY